MIRSALTLLLIVLTTSGCAELMQNLKEGARVPTTPRAIARLHTQADRAWAKRGSPDSLELAIASWEKIHAAKPDQPDLLAKLARAYFLRGDHFQTLNEQDKALAMFEKGVVAGEHGLMASSQEFATRVLAGEKVGNAFDSIPLSGQPVLYWYAVNLGKFVSLKGIRSILFYKDRLMSAMQRVLELDETYFHAAPHRYFGAYYSRAPAFAGGDMSRARAHFEKALTLAPEYLDTKVTYAEFFAVKNQDKALFQTLLNAVIAADPKTLPEVEPEQRAQQRKAQKLLAATDSLF